MRHVVQYVLVAVLRQGSVKWCQHLRCLTKVVIDLTVPSPSSSHAPRKVTAMAKREPKAGNHGPSPSQCPNKACENLPATDHDDEKGGRKRTNRRPSRRIQLTELK